MSGYYSAGKRAREVEQADKRRAKEDKRRRKRDAGPAAPQITTREEMNRNVPSPEAAMRNIERRAAGVKGTSGPPCRLYVGGLSFDTTGETLRATLATFGVVSDAVVVQDRTTGMSRGFGFVTMASRKDAAKAIEALNDTELEGRNIVVKAASERER